MQETEQSLDAPTPSEAETSEVSGEEKTDELSELRARVRELEDQIALSEQQQTRAAQECEEFGRYFPDVPLCSVPDEVWGKVRSGVPLSAAYALYETRCRREKEAEQREKARTAAMSVGIPDEAGRDYFSPAQVRAMSQREVRENYDRIFESMRHWQ